MGRIFGVLCQLLVFRRQRVVRKKIQQHFRLIPIIGPKPRCFAFGVAQRVGKVVEQRIFRPLVGTVVAGKSGVLRRQAAEDQFPGRRLRAVLAVLFQPFEAPRVRQFADGQIAPVACHAPLDQRAHILLEPFEKVSL